MADRASSLGFAPGTALNQVYANTLGVQLTGSMQGQHLFNNGTGIKAEHLDKIFDPFFTTKDVGEGMGLGLSICYRIVRECEGHIAVRTEPGKFCEFALEFPAKGVTLTE